MTTQLAQQAAKADAATARAAMTRAAAARKDHHGKPRPPHAEGGVQEALAPRRRRRPIGP